MDFSNNVFRPSASSSLSHDTMDHAKMVMACRFGWSAGPSDGVQGSHAPPTTHVSTPPTTSSNAFKINKRFAPCRGRLYHQLTCSHRIRTDLVEDCGSNCLDPITNASGLAFYCHECVEKEASSIWIARETEHNALYPSIEQMSKEQYEQWYSEHRHMEAQFANDRRAFELALKKTTRPSNICTASQASQEEMDFATELESLSLALASSKTSPIQPLATRESRISLPNDMSEQLHWSLNSLSLERGSCGVEYSPTKNVSHSTMRTLDEGEFWHKPRDQK
ncbi:hypothetical protein B0J11DRAFT_554612 [Dendryphion nanum]|uniref:Uncharacterized protein n=1 Tax=Dendryphion nanum TaxID=256645 RepID=A0A9P9I7G0_9PLEO|nr:hypothetical protein B0J11DRAFT_554612 [Dendryphion nanum]